MPVLNTASPKVSPSAPNAVPAERRAVLEDEQRGRSPHRVAFPSATVNDPRSIV